MQNDFIIFRQNLEIPVIVQPVREEFSAGDSNVQKREGIRGLECHPP